MKDVVNCDGKGGGETEKIDRNYKNHGKTNL